MARSLNRVVMQKTSRSWIDSLGPNTLDALEISGDWGRAFGFQTFETLRYPDFDICAGPALDTEGRVRTFDIILANQVWEHLDHPYHAARHVFAMLRPGAWFWLAVPFFIPFHAVPQDCSRWTARGLHNLLADQGFDPVTLKSAQWGNRAAALRNLELPWPPAYRPGEDDLTNDAKFPLVAWAMGQRPF